MPETRTIACSEVESDVHGNPVALDPASALWAISDHSVVGLTQRSDGTASFTALKPGRVNFTCTDVRTGEIGSGMLEVDESLAFVTL